MTSISLLRHLFRFLARYRSVSITAALLLAVGMGSNAAVFSIVNDVFFRPLSGVEDPERLVALLRVGPGGTSGFSHQDFTAYRTEARSFVDLVASRGEDLWWREGEVQRELGVRLVTEGYFSLVGVRMALGRSFSPEETTIPEAHPVTVLSHELWRSAFASDPGVLGREMRLNGTPFTVVGVAPPAFRGVEVGESPDLWIPLMMEGVTRPSSPGLNNGFWRVFQVLGRLRPGVGAETAQGALTALAARIENPSGPEGERPRILLRHDVRRGDPGFTSFALFYLAPFFGVGLVLVIVCANLAGILVALNFQRRRELAIRTALGASRRGLVGHLVAESVFLAGVGTGVGILIARWIPRWVQAHGIPDLADLDLSPDLRVVGFTAVVALLAGVGIGLIPALQATGRDLVGDLRERAGASRRTRTYGLLVSLQVGLSLVLLTGAGLLARNFLALNGQDPGFDTEDFLLVACDLREGGYSQAAAGEFLENLTARLRGLPGVRAVVRSNEVPVDRGWTFSDGTTVIAEDGVPADRERVARTRVTPGYFDALGLELLAGRDFSAQDDSLGPRVAIVNENLARRLWPGRNPVGQRFYTLFIDIRSDPVTVVGVSPEVQSFSYVSEPRPEIFVPLGQVFAVNQWILIRQAERAGELAPAVREEIRRLAPDLPPATIETVAQRRTRRYSEDKFFSDMTGAFGILGLALSALGLWGLLSLDVSGRVREMGVRMALGARKGQVIQSVLGRGLLISLPGIGLGFLGSLALARLARGYLFGVPDWDPILFVGTTCILLAVIMGTSLFPAMRAASSDPSKLLRVE
ncbi:MAG: ABC transporter permease [Gemmatimonadales bacterium]|nr:MAG: ABC transporter permease [Gemmatimonadales bacterium]